MALNLGLDLNAVGLAALRYALQEQADAARRKERLDELLLALGVNGDLEEIDPEPPGSGTLILDPPE
jgi:hypothetical protein